MDAPIRVQGLGEFIRRFGGLWEESPTQLRRLSLLRQRRVGHAHRARAQPDGTGHRRLPRVRAYLLPAARRWAWLPRTPAPGATSPRVAVTAGAGASFDLTVTELSATNPTQVVATERFLNLTLTSGDVRFVTQVLEQGSQLLRLETLPSAPPTATGAPLPFTGGADGLAIDADQVSTPTSPATARASTPSTRPTCSTCCASRRSHRGRRRLRHLGCGRRVLHHPARHAARRPAIGMERAGRRHQRPVQCADSLRQRRHLLPSSARA